MFLVWCLVSKEVSEQGLSVVEFLTQEFPCDTLGAGGNLLRSAAGYEVSASVATIGTEVDDVVGTLDDLHVMLDDGDGMPSSDECVEGMKQSLDIMEV